MTRSSLEKTTAITVGAVRPMTPEQARDRFDRAAARLAETWTPPPEWDGLSEMEILEAVTELTKQK